MPALQVRDFPEDLYTELKERAQQEYRSIAQQTIVAVQEHVDGVLVGRAFRQGDQEKTVDHRARRAKVLERIDALPVFEVPDDFPTPEQIVRELRDGR